METYLVEASTKGQKLAAGSAALVVLLGFLFMAPVATQSLGSVTAFLPAFATAMSVTAALTGFLLAAQFLVLRVPALGLLSAAYLFTTVIIAFQVLASPGVFAQPLFPEAGPQSAVWLWVLWQGGFATFILVAMLVQRYSRDALIPVQHAKSGWILFVVLALSIAALSVLTAIHYAHLLPDLISATDRRPLSQNPIILFVWLLTLAALLSIVTVTRLRNPLFLWLGVAVLASLVSVSLTLIAGSRYSIGWYGARLLGLASSSAVLGALLWEFNRLYRELFRMKLTLIDSSVRDSMTGLYNRSYMDMQFAIELGRARRHHGSVSLLIIDIDQFNRYNETFGFQRGDNCLVAIAEALNHEIHRPADFIARFSGQKFVIVLPDANEHGAALVAERVRVATEKRRIAAPEGVVTVSIGTATSTIDAPETSETMIAIAEDALARAKLDGRNRVVAGVIDTPEIAPEVS